MNWFLLIPEASNLVPMFKSDIMTRNITFCIWTRLLFEEISDDYPDLTNTQIRNTLAAFLFTGEDVFKKISSLSGGERGRVSLAKLMLSESNFLILDEPTNHLDITSKEILESALNAYEGTVLYVSHDRYFYKQDCFPHSGTDS